MSRRSKPRLAARCFAGWNPLIRRRCSALHEGACSSQGRGLRRHVRGPGRARFEKRAGPPPPPPLHQLFQGRLLSAGLSSVERERPSAGCRPQVQRRVRRPLSTPRSGPSMVKATPAKDGGAVGPATRTPAPFRRRLLRRLRRGRPRTQRQPLASCYAPTSHSARTGRGLPRSAPWGGHAQRSRRLDSRAPRPRRRRPRPPVGGTYAGQADITVSFINPTMRERGITHSAPATRVPVHTAISRPV